MPETLFAIETRLPFAWTATPGEQDCAAMQLGARLLLSAINQMEAAPGHPDRSEPRLDRLEAKLDLMLHWLGRNLHGGRSAPEAVLLRLDAAGVSWSQHVMPGTAENVTLSLYLHPALVAPLELPGRVAESAEGRVRVEFQEMDEALHDLWSQWLFRRHRRAIHAAREGS